MASVLKRFKSFVPLVVFLILMDFLVWGLHHDPHKLPSLLIGKIVPAFNKPSLADSSAMLTEHVFKGHYTLLNVFATWCVTCHAEHPVLVDIANSKKIRLVGLNYKDKRERGLRWLRNAGDPFSQIIFDKNGSLAVDLGVYGTPESFIINPKGIIVYKHVGAISQDVWSSEILPEINMLEGKGL
ncbi:MAG: DsbE family thiol:disulfide interchange protein [Coxiellaceae bacterium]|nr:DsbE family thiol:disulfide interchange protein [Coxiellaceae bacterium]